MPAIIQSQEGTGSLHEVDKGEKHYSIDNRQQAQCLLLYTPEAEQIDNKFSILVNQLVSPRANIELAIILPFKNRNKL